MRHAAGSSARCEQPVCVCTSWIKEQQLRGTLALQSGILFPISITWKAEIPNHAQMIWTWKEVRSVLGGTRQSMRGWWSCTGKRSAEWRHQPAQVMYSWALHGLRAAGHQCGNKVAPLGLKNSLVSLLHDPQVICSPHVVKSPLHKWTRPSLVRKYCLS